MAVGDYFIDEPIVIGSYTTLEGGYNATFTQKTSSQNTSGAFPDRGTRIIRRNTQVDPGSPGFPLNFDTFLSFFLPLNLSIL
ncbi:MAG: hypothetical protein KatS3mg035_2074 [Bacteroidia bacterium]|nr:MAG: hypothetical protein KatS3mg035_2074 [Bacteroidia bacterium]